MSRITQRPNYAPVEILTTSTDQSLATLVGARFDTSDGREFVVAQNAGTAIAAGKVVQSPAKVANHSGLTVVSYTAASIVNGTPAQVVVTLSGTAVLANEYQTGFLIVNTNTGVGQTLKIRGHAAQATTTGNVTVYLEDAPVVALDTTSTVSLVKNPYGSLNGTDNSTNGVIVSPATTLTGQTLGLTVYNFPASTATVAQYALIQTRGYATVLSQGGTTAYRDLMVPGSVAGAVATYAVASGTRVGVAVGTATDAQYAGIAIQL